MKLRRSNTKRAALRTLNDRVQRAERAAAEARRREQACADECTAFPPPGFEFFRDPQDGRGYLAPKRPWRPVIDEGVYRAAEDLKRAVYMLPGPMIMPGVDDVQREAERFVSLVFAQFRQWREGFDTPTAILEPLFAAWLDGVAFPRRGRR